MWPKFRAISAGVGLEKPSPHTGCQKDCVQAGEAEPLLQRLSQRGPYPGYANARCLFVSFKLFEL